jgi:hypothetical protein
MRRRWFGAALLLLHIRCSVAISARFGDATSGALRVTVGPGDLLARGIALLDDEMTEAGVLENAEANMTGAGHRRILSDRTDIHEAIERLQKARFDMEDTQGMRDGSTRSAGCVLSTPKAHFGRLEYILEDARNLVVLRRCASFYVKTFATFSAWSPLEANSTQITHAEEVSPRFSVVSYR